MSINTYQDAIDIAHDIEFHEISNHPEYILCKLFTIDENILDIFIDVIVNSKKLKKDMKGELILIGVHRLLSKGYSIVFFYRKIREEN